MIVLLMGPAGSGKSSVGELLSAELGWEFLDADRFHSEENRLKMARGEPLGDSERLPWLGAIRQALLGRSGRNLVLACSALKQDYRDRLGDGLEVRVVYLAGSPELLAARLKSRRGHFFAEKLLLSQLADLEEPVGGLSLDIRHSPDELAREIRERLHLG